MEAALVWRPDLAAYDFGEGHPLDPVRVTLSVALMRDYAMLTPQITASAPPADDATLELVHSAEYVKTVREASASPARF